MPQDPGAPSYLFSVERAEPGEDLIGVGADLAPATILAAYRAGVFPMGLGRNGGRPMGWWSPDPRGVLPLEALRVSRSLRRSCRRLRVSVDVCFERVVAACADPRRDGRWITRSVAHAYADLHRLGWAHSVEVWQRDELVGGLYGVAIGGLFAGESMFHRVDDASKVALVALRDMLADDGDPRRLLDVQWLTPHLASMGAREVPRAAYLRQLSAALQTPLPASWR
ncbi:MAG: leucyl/phenylalanyl-tRNA--protein transferase [Actinomycetales bacterium]|nr:leucyl/phenylalanyl-tRNA--protein transferase [Actinomycetales bacterium]